MKNNVQILTHDELDKFNSTYSFNIVDDNIYVKTMSFNRVTVHSKHENFSINSFKKLTITPLAIKLWQELYKDKYTLIDVQNALNILFVLHKDDNLDEIKEVLENKYVIRVKSLAKEV